MVTRHFCDNCGCLIPGENYKNFDYDFHDDDLGFNRIQRMELCSGCYFELKSLFEKWREKHRR